MIRLSNVSKKVSNLLSLSNISFEINKNDCYLIYSTFREENNVLAKILAKILKPDKGNVFYESIENDDVRIMYEGVEKNISLSTTDYLLFYGKLNGINSKEIMKDIFFYFNKYNIENLKYIMFDELNKSQKKIINLISLLISKRKVFIIEDPYNHISENEKYIVSTILEDIKINNTLIILATNINDYIEFCNKIVILDNGSISIIGDTKDALKLYGYKNCIEINYEGEEDEVTKVLLNISNIKKYTYYSDYIYISTYFQNQDYEILEALVKNNIKVISFKRINKI